MPRRRTKKKTETKPKPKRAIFSPLDRDGPYQNHPGSSPFLKLPGEIRNEIYLFLFSSTRISFGEEMWSNEKRRRGKLYVRPSMHSLSLLHTCRQIHIEANPLWTGMLLLHFGSSHAMINRILAFPKAKIGDIRQLRLRWSYDFQTRYDTMPDVHNCDIGFMHTLYLLRLERFTILFDQSSGVYVQEKTAYAIFQLMRCGSYWKELHCIINNSSILSELARDPEKSLFFNRMMAGEGISANDLRSMGIFTVNDYIKKEFHKPDGKHENASIRVCRSTVCAHNDSNRMMNPECYVELDKKKPLTTKQLKASCRWVLIAAKRANPDFESHIPSGRNQTRLHTSEGVLSPPKVEYRGYVYDHYNSPSQYSWQIRTSERRKKKKKCVLL